MELAEDGCKFVIISFGSVAVNIPRDDEFDWQSPMRDNSQPERSSCLVSKPSSTNTPTKTHVEGAEEVMRGGNLKLACLYARESNTWSLPSFNYKAI